MDEDVGVGFFANPKPTVVKHLSTVDYGFAMGSVSVEENWRNAKATYSIPWTTAAIDEIIAT